MIFHQLVPTSTSLPNTSVLPEVVGKECNASHINNKDMIESYQNVLNSSNSEKKESSSSCNDLVKNTNCVNKSKYKSDEIFMNNNLKPLIKSISSFSNPSIKYDVDIIAQTCTCPHYVHKKAICKHIVLCNNILLEIVE